MHPGRLKHPPWQLGHLQQLMDLSLAGIRSMRLQLLPIFLACCVQLLSNFLLSFDPAGWSS
jgi:hypothetical protein